MESTPVSGVEIRNETVAPLVAPCRRKPSAAGSTPQEQSGSGAPIADAQSTDLTLPVPKKRISVRAGTSDREHAREREAEQQEDRGFLQDPPGLERDLEQEVDHPVPWGRLETARALQPGPARRCYCGRYFFSSWQATEYCGSTTLAISIWAAWPRSWSASNLS